MFQTADSNIIVVRVKGTIPCRQSVYNYWYILVIGCGSVVKKMHAVGYYLDRQQTYTCMQRVGALVYGADANEPTCTTLVMPLSRWNRGGIWGK